MHLCIAAALGPAAPLPGPLSIMRVKADLRPASMLHVPLPSQFAQAGLKFSFSAKGQEISQWWVMSARASGTPSLFPDRGRRGPSHSEE